MKIKNRTLKRATYIEAVPTTKGDTKRKKIASDHKSYAAEGNSGQTDIPNHGDSIPWTDRHMIIKCWTMQSIFI